MKAAGASAKEDRRATIMEGSEEIATRALAGAALGP